MRTTHINTIVFLMIVHLSPVVLAQLVDRQVGFKGDGGATLSGTFESLQGKGSGAAVVLLAGSGPTDRDGNQLPGLKTDLLKQIAQHLAERGIASLRFDKRGMNANSAEMPKDKSKLGDFFSWEHFVGDAEAGYRFTRQQPGVNPNLVGLVGHSEGGLLALQAATTLKDEKIPPAALILISTPGRSIDLILAEQLKHALARQGATTQQSEYFLHENARIDDAIRTTGEIPADVPGGLAALYPAYLGKFFHSELAVNPCELAADFSGPVLIVAGEADVQVSLERDAKALDKALAGRKGDVHLLVIAPNASHNLKIPASPTDAQFAGPVSPYALTHIQDWAAEHVAAR